MQHACARLRTDGRWDWTVKHDGVVRPARYCAGWSALDPDAPTAALLADWQGREAPLQGRYHTDGHATAEEAERCAWMWERDHVQVQLVGWVEPCVATGCDEPGRWRVKDSWGAIPACEAHATVDTWEALHPFRPGTQEWSS